MFAACDESNIDKQIWIIGSSWIPRNLLAEYEKSVTNFRLQEKLWGEIKWSKLTSQTFEKYKKFLTLTFDNFHPEFKAIVIDTNLVDFDGFHNKNKQLAFMKFYGLLLTKKARHILTRPGNVDTKFHIIVDEFNVSSLNFNDLKSFTERQIKKYKMSLTGAIQDDFIVDFLGRHTSHICSLTQFTDLISGAIGAAWNAGINQRHQQDLVGHIESLSNHSLSVPNAPIDCKFDIWKWRPSLPFN